MTREEQILKAGIEYTIANKPKCIAGDNFKDLADIFNRNPAFEAGAQWADAHPHWISVEDKLPPCNVFVLTCDGQENENLLMLGGNGRWYDKAMGLHRNITHWMPLPRVEHLRETTKMIEKGGEE